MKYRSPSVAIIILNWNSKEYTEQCLASLNKMDFRKFSVFVVDCGSNDNSQKHLLNCFPWITLIECDRNPGAAAGRNLGLAKAMNDSFDYFLFLDNDTEVSASFLTELISAAESKKNYSIFAPMIYFYGMESKIWYAGGRLSQFRGVPIHDGFKKRETIQHSKAKQVGYIPSTAMLNRRSVIESLKKMDETFFVYGEDADWYLRASKLGFKGYYVPNAKVWHKEGVTRKNKGNRFRKYLSTRNIMYLVYKHNSKLSFFLFIIYFTFIRMSIHSFKYTLKREFPEVIGLWQGYFAFWPLLGRQKEN